MDCSPRPVHINLFAVCLNVHAVIAHYRPLMMFAPRIPKASSIVLPKRSKKNKTPHWLVPFQRLKATVANICKHNNYNKYDLNENPMYHIFARHNNNTI